ncbi:MAG: hypothetical protein AAB972_02460 [Patescibacteria group bacterium]
MEHFENQSKNNQDQLSQGTKQPIKKSPQHHEKPPLSGIRDVVGGYKEKITDFLRYKKLKIKEYSGKLDQNEFDELLSSEFQDQLRDNPPIGKVFSPEQELLKIRKAPKGEKRELLSVFKENLTRQREALANCRVFIERSIEFNHDVPGENLVRILQYFRKEYGFTDEQRQIIAQLIDGYYENRRKVLEIRKFFPDNTTLVKKLTGVQFSKTDKLNVAVGPMTIDISTEGFNAGRIYEEAGGPVIDFKHNGFAFQSHDADPIFYIVLNEDKDMRKLLNDPTGTRVRQHEHEHQKNKLFRAVFEHTASEQETDYLWGEYEIEDDEWHKRIFLENYFYARREHAWEKAKDEITASLQNMSLPQLQQDFDWMFLQQEDNSYDYLAVLRDFEPKKDDLLYQETSQKMLVEEYKSVIEKAVGSFAELVNKGGYSIQEAIALLTDKSLPHWPKTIQRLLEHNRPTA